MNKIVIFMNGNGDTRSAKKDVTYPSFQVANNWHIRDVKTVMSALVVELTSRAEMHDYTKKLFEKDFWHDFKSVLDNGGDFTKMHWYQKHIHSEKHHPTSYLHEDFNLFDLIETIVDCVCAGKARSGEVRPMEFNDDIVKLAVQNTIKLVDDMTTVYDVENEYSDVNLKFEED